MKPEHTLLHRRHLLLGLGLAGSGLLIPGTAQAQLFGKQKSPSLGLSSILGKATDGALDKLAQPGAYWNDEDIRIGLPGLGGGQKKSGGLLGDVLGAVGSLGAIPGLDGILRGINDAAGKAAGEAKPIFRTAIDDLSFSDAPGIIKQADGGTQYLRQSSNDALHAKLEPLIDSALSAAGIHAQIERLASGNSVVRQLGFDRAGINKTVTDQGLDGIFKYVGNEERGFRKNPLKGLGGLLGQ